MRLPDLLFTFGLTHHSWAADFGLEAKCKPINKELSEQKGERTTLVFMQVWLDIVSF